MNSTPLPGGPGCDDVVSNNLMVAREDSRVGSKIVYGNGIASLSSDSYDL
jgi:hypothetical protein